MSKLTARRAGLAILIVATPIAVIFLFFVIIGLGFFTIPNIKAKHRLSQEYSKLTLPGYFQMTSQRWQDGGIDNAAEWEYAYTSSKPIDTMSGDLITSLHDAGYVVTAVSPTNTTGAQITYNGTNNPALADRPEEGNTTSIHATKNSFYVEFNIHQNEVDSLIYEAHTGGK